MDIEKLTAEELEQHIILIKSRLFDNQIIGQQLSRDLQLLLKEAQTRSKDGSPTSTLGK